MSLEFDKNDFLSSIKVLCSNKNISSNDATNEYVYRSIILGLKGIGQKKRKRVCDLNIFPEKIIKSCKYV